MTKLKPCSSLHCTGKGLVVRNKGIYYVYCLSCGRRTSSFEREFEAVKAWNRRAK